MKKLITTYAFLMLVSGIFAQTTFTVGVINYTTTSPTTVAVTNGGTYTGSITIPSTVIYSAVTYNVTSIGNSAFYYCTGLTSITIPSSVTSIGNTAFSRTGLTSITIPSSVTSIGSQAFAFSTGLTSITIPSSVTSIGANAFQSCVGLASITIPSSVTSIGDFAFTNCTGLTSITIPSSVTSIGVQVFYICTGLTSITIPGSVTSIGSGAFMSCTKLTSVTIPSSVTSIGSFAFDGCTGLTTLTCLSSTPPTFGFNCFANITTITDVYVPTDAAVAAYQKNADWIARFPDPIIKKMPTSSSDGNWNVSTNWSGGVVPTAGQPVVIANNISLDVNASVSDLIINNGSVLNVNAGKQLTVSTTFTNNGTLNLLSTAANGTATILTPATLSGTGSYNVQQFLNGKTGTSTRANWYLSSPVSGATAAVFNVEGGINKMTSYNELTTNYLTQFSLNSTALTPGKGYVTYIGGADATYTFTGGNLNNGDITLTPTRTGTDAGKRGFNLVGNPYPSYLNWASADIVKTNVRSTIWYRTLLSGSSTGVMTFDTFDGTTGTANGQNGAVSRYIPPMQAFWVRVDVDNTPASLKFVNLARSHQGQSVVTNRLRAPAQTNTDPQIVRLKVSNGTNGDEALIVADPNALDGFDNYDSQKMTNDNVNIPEIYTVAGSEELVINHLNAINTDKELTLGFRPGKTGDFTIEATEISNLDNNLKVMLLDKLTNTQQEIKVGSPYSFSSDATATNNRFSVLFKDSSSPTGLDNPSSNGDVTVYRNAANHVTVVCNANVNEKSLVSVYNAVGQRLIQQKLTGKFTEINNTFMPGIYIVSVNNGGQSVTKKIIFN